MPVLPAGDLTMDANCTENKQSILTYLQALIALLSCADECQWLSGERRQAVKADANAFIPHYLQLDALSLQESCNVACSWQ